MAKMGTSGLSEQKRSELQVVELAMSLLILSLVFQVSTASPQSWVDVYETWDSDRWTGGGWELDDHNSAANPFGDLWGEQLGSQPSANWSVLVGDTGLGAAVQVVSIGQPPNTAAEITVTMTGPGANKTAILQNLGNGGYTVYLSAGKPGDYQVKVTIGGQSIGDPSYTVHVVSEPSAFTSVVTPCSSALDAGADCLIQVLANDVASSPISTPSKICPFKFKIWDTKGLTYTPSSITGPVAGDGKCNATFTPLRSGAYTVRVSIGGKVLLTSGEFNITVAPSATAAANFQLYSPDLLPDTTYGVGVVTFYIQSIDPKYTAIHNFTISIVSPNITLLRSCDDARSDPQCSFRVNLTRPDSFIVTVKIDNTTDITGSPLTMKLSSGYVSGSLSKISFSGNESSLLAGSDSPAYDVVLMDVFGNPTGNYSYGDYSTMLVVDLVSVSKDSSYPYYAATIAPAASGAGAFTATFKNLTYAGNYSVRAWYGNSENVLEGSGISLVVTAGPPVAAMSLIQVPQKFIAGGSAGVVGFLGDQWGNAVYGNTDVSFSLTSTDASNPITTNHTAMVAGTHYQAYVGEGITKAGTYTLKLTAGGVQLATGTVNCTSSRFSAKVSNFTVITNFTTGAMGNFSLALMDEFGNPLENNRAPLISDTAVVEVNGSAAAKVETSWVDNGTASVVFNFKSDVAGPYDIRVPYNMQFPGSEKATTQITVYAGHIDGSRCSLTGPGLGGGPAGSNFTIYIIPRDSYGNRLPANAADAALITIALSVTDRKGTANPVTPDPLRVNAVNGRYETNFNSTFAGRAQFNVTASTKSVTATFSIYPAKLSPSKSTMTGLGLSGTVVNQMATFFISAKDGYENVMDDLGSAGDEFQLKLCKVGAICVNLTCTDDCAAGRISVRDRHMYGGLYAVMWSAPTVGTYDIHVSYGGENITGSPISAVKVITLAERGGATAVNALVCGGFMFKYSCPGYFGSVAGVKGRFQIALADSKGIWVASSGSALAITLTPADATAVTEIVDTNDGLYTITYMIMKIPVPAAPISLAVSLGAATVTTASLTITPAWTSADKSSISPAFVALLTAGGVLTTTITPMDNYGNIQVYNKDYPLTNDQFSIIAIRETGERVYGKVTWNTSNLVFDASLTLTWSGIYWVAVQLNEVTLGTTGASMTVTVNPTTPTIGNSALLQPWLPPIRSTEVASFQVPSLADKYGNLIVKDLLFTANATLIGASAPTEIPLLCALTNTTNALATCTYNFTTVGSYNISYGANGFVATTAIKVLAGPAAPTSKVTGTATTNCTVGHRSVMMIECYDISGNNCSGQPGTAFKVRLTPSGINMTSNEVIADVWSTKNGTFAAYIVKEVGNYTLNVTLQDGTNITGSPFTVDCSHAFSTPSISLTYVVDPPRKLDAIGKVPIVAGSVIQMGVMILDANGNRQHHSVVDTLIVDFSPKDAPATLATGAYLSPVVSNGDATFSFSVSATKVGYSSSGVFTALDYELKVNVTTADEPSRVAQGVQGAPYIFNVLPDTISIPSTSVVLLSTVPDMNGLTSTFRIITQDAFGNVAAYNQTLNVSAIVTKYVEVPTPVVSSSPPPTKLRRNFLQLTASTDDSSLFTLTPTVVNNFDGTYIFTFSVTKAGPYNISVFIDTELVGPGPGPTLQDFEVGPGVPYLSRLEPSGSCLGKDSLPLPVNVPGNMSLAINDMFGNPVTVGTAAATTYIINITAEIQLRVPQVNAFIIYRNAKSNITLTPWAVGATDGAITAKYTATQSGIAAFYLTYGDPATGLKWESVLSPVWGVITPGPIDPTTIKAYGSGLIAAVISFCDQVTGACVISNNSILVEMFDAGKNKLDAGTMAETCANITTEYNVIAGLLTMTPTASVSRSGSTCLVQYSVPDTNLTGPVEFNISYGGTLIAGAPFKVPLKRSIGDPSMTKSFATGDMGGVIEAGMQGKVTVQLVDKDGVWLSTSPGQGSDYVQLALFNRTDGVATPSLYSDDNEDGSFTLTFQTSSAGYFGFLIAVGPNLRTLGSPFVIRVVASDTMVSTVSVALISTNVSVYRAGKDPVLIEVQAQDASNNLQDYYFSQPDIFTARITQPDGTTAYQTLDRIAAISSSNVPYYKWLLTFYPDQAPAKSSTLYTFVILWSNGTAEEVVPSAPIKINTMPGPPAANNIKVLGQGGSKTVVGADSHFVVQLFDALNNPVTSLTDIMNTNVTMVLWGLGGEELSNKQCGVSSSPPGALCTYTLTMSGTYAIDIYVLDTRQFQQSVTVQPAAIYAPNCRAAGDGVGTTGNPIIVGQPAEFMIEAMDFVNGTVSPTAKQLFSVKGYNLNSTGVILPAPGFPKLLQGTNRYLVRYTAMKSGLYLVAVTRASVHISGSPFSVNILPGEISSRSTVDDATMANCTSGETHTVTVTARDIQGNIRDEVVDVLTIVKTVAFANETVVDHMTSLGFGRYTWSYTCLTAGTRDDRRSTMIDIYSGKAVVWSDKLLVVPGPADSSQFIVGAFDLVSVGNIGTTTIVTADSAGNLLWEGGLMLEVNVGMNGANTTASGTDNLNGTYDFTWMVTVAGTYTVIAALDGQTFYAEDVVVFPGPPDAASTSITFDGNNGYKAGTQGYLWIQFYDAYMNNITMDILNTTDLTFVSISNDPEPRRREFLAQDINYNGISYTVTFTPYFSGMLFVHLMVAGQEVFTNGEPYSTSVGAGVPYPKKFYAWGGGWEHGGVVSETATFFVRMRDAMGNLVDTELVIPLTVGFSSSVATDPSQNYIGSGVIQISYTPSGPSVAFTIAVAYDGVPALSSQTLLVKAAEGNYSSAMSAIFSTDGSEVDNQILVYATAGDSLGFMIQPRDEDGMPINNPNTDNPNLKIPNYIVRISGTPSQLIESDSSTFQASFGVSSTEARDYIVVVQSSDSTHDVSNSGFTVKFLPGPSSAPNCLVTTPSGEAFDPNRPLVAGSWLKLMVEAQDAYNNLQVYNILSPDSFIATLTAGTTTQAIGLSVGYTSTYTFKLPVSTVSGPGILSITLNGAQVVSYAVVVIASTLFLRSTEITPMYLEPMNAGVESSFDITPVDNYQNIIAQVNATQQVFATLAVYDRVASRYKFIEQASMKPAMLSPGLHATVTPRVAGRYSVIASDGAGRISGDPSHVVELATVEVFPGEVDITRSYATVQPTYFAGSTISFLVTGLDSNNNLVLTVPTVSTDPYYEVEVLSSCPTMNYTLCQKTVGFTCNVTFWPHSYGPVNVTMTWDGTAALEYLIDLLPRAPPTILTAQMSDTMGSILVSFDGVSDAGLKSLRGVARGADRCEALLDNSTFPKIGTNPSCEFRDSATMVIKLGYDATIAAADSSKPDNIGLRDEGVFATAETSPAASGAVLLRPPVRHPPLVAVLAGPTYVGACDNFVLDATASYGSGGRPMIFRYHVKGTGDLLKVAALGAILEALPNDTMIVTIPSGSLEANHLYTFVLVLTNYFGKRATTTVTVTATVNPVPIVNIYGAADTPQIFMRGQMVSLEANAVIPGTKVYDLATGTCLAPKTKVNTTATQMFFQWTQTSGPYANLKLMGSSARALNIPGNQLVVGAVYTFMVTVSMAGWPDEFSTATASVQVKSSPVQVMIKGGDRKVNSSQDLFLEAVAFDPDDSVDEFGGAYEFRFEWTSSPALAIPDSLLYQYTEINFGSIIRIPAKTMTNGSVYTFTVSVSKEGAPNVTKSVLITPIETGAMSFTAEILNWADFSMGIYSTSTLVIKCTPGYENYTWMMASDGDQRLLWELNPVSIQPGTIKIPHHNLLEDRSYQITCSAVNSEGIIGTASVSFATALNPTGGTATLTQNTKNNMAGKTVYKLVAHGWMAGTGGGALLYEFRYTYKRGKNWKEVVLQPLSSSNAVNDFVLLGGKVTLKVYVVDSGIPRIKSNDAPPGAVFRLPVISVSGKGRRLLESVNFPTAYWSMANEGKYFNSLTAMEVLGTQSMNSPSSRCASSNKALSQKMLAFIIKNNPQYPAASSTGGGSGGPGPLMALKTACVLSKLVGKPGNANQLDQLQATLAIYMRDLTLISKFGLNAAMIKSMPYDPCFFDAGNAFMQAVKSKCYKLDKESEEHQQLLNTVSTIPNLLARVLVNDVGFVSPYSIKRNLYTAAALSFAMGTELKDGQPNMATGTINNVQFDITSIRTDGVSIGVALSCFMNSPLSTTASASLKASTSFMSVLQVCDVSFTGHTDADWGQTTIRASWMKLKKLNKKDSYMPVMITDGMPHFGYLRNIYSTYKNVSFDFARAYSRIAVIRVKGDNFSTVASPPPPPSPPATNSTKMSLFPTFNLERMSLMPVSDSSKSWSWRRKKWTEKSSDPLTEIWSYFFGRS